MLPNLVSIDLQTMEIRRGFFCSPPYLVDFLYHLGLRYHWGNLASIAVKCLVDTYCLKEAEFKLNTI